MKKVMLDYFYKCIGAEKDIYQKIKRRIIFAYITLFLASVLYFIGATFFMFADEFTSLGSAGYGITYFIFYCCLVLTPPEIG